MLHTTIMRWPHHYSPELERRWNRFARPAAYSWRVDETSVKIRGQCVYLYRGVCRKGKAVVSSNWCAVAVPVWAAAKCPAEACHQ
jgi:IS6 family transposase